MKIKVAYFPGLGGQSPTLGNVRGFQHFGDVDFLTTTQMKQKDYRVGADLIFTPDFVTAQQKISEIFIILQMGGRGPIGFWRMGYFNQLPIVTKNADLVTMLDPNLHHFINRKEFNLPWEWDLISMVPNGLHYDMFQPAAQQEEHETFTILTSKIGSPGKSGIDEMMVANRLTHLGYQDKIRLLIPVQAGGNTLSFDRSIKVAELIESRPFYKMPQLYQQADLYLNIPEEEVLPNTVFEAFQTGLPVLVRKDTKNPTIGRIQTVATKYLEEMKKDFGLSIEAFDEKWSERYESGVDQHYQSEEAPQEVAKKIIFLYENPDLCKKIGENARQWSLRLNWTWHNKCELLMKLAEEAGFEVGRDRYVKTIISVD